MLLAAETGMPTGARVVLIVVTLLSLLFILRLVRYRRLKGKYALLWGAVGICIGVFAIVPDSLVPVARAMGVAEGNEPAIVFFAAIVFLFLVVVHFSWELSRSRSGAVRLPRRSRCCGRSGSSSGWTPTRRPPRVRHRWVGVAVLALRRGGVRGRRGRCGPRGAHGTTSTTPPASTSTAPVTSTTSAAPRAPAPTCPSA